MKLPPSFYLNPDVTQVARELLGKYLYTHFDGMTVAGMIVESEAYSTRERACHAYDDRFTQRTRVLFEAGGIAYVYLCYGIHALFNVVTNQQGVAEAVLIRAVEPKIGLDVMSSRRGMSAQKKNLTSGPGKITKALGIDLTHNETSLSGKEIWIEDQGVVVKESQVEASPRIGVDYAGEDALLPWRFTIKDNPWISGK